MRPTVFLAAIAALAAVFLAGCGSAKVVSPKPETVIGSVPTQTAPASTSSTSSTGGTGGQTSGTGSAGNQSGKAVFASNGCGSCHTYKAAGSNGKIGPDLDKLAQYAKQAKKPLDPFVRESIVNPKAYVQPGFQPIMPSFASLAKPQLDALVKFLTTGS
jgi:cytochrome c551/c552